MQCLHVCTYMQIAERLRLDLAASNLQLTREYTFNTEGNVKQAVEALKVCEHICYYVTETFTICFIALYRTLPLELFS